MQKGFWWFFISLPAAAVIYVPLILLWLEFRQWPVSEFSWWRYGVSFLLLWGGIVLVMWSMLLLVKDGEADTTHFHLKTKKLVTDGPYKIVRNPIAIGISAILFGEALYFGSWFVFIWALIVSEAMSYYITRYEEYKLANQFGQAYIDYKLDVGKWLPHWALVKQWFKK